MENIDYLVAEAQFGLNRGSQSKFNELIEYLQDDINKWCRTANWRMSFIEHDLLKSIYMESVWEVVLKYDDGINDFIKYVWKVAWNKANDVSRDELPHIKRKAGFERIMEIAEYEDPRKGKDGDLGPVGFSGRNKVVSAEEDYFDREAMETFIKHLDGIKSIGEYEKALIRHRIEYGTSYNDLIEICGLQDEYRNKQQLARSTTKKIGGFDING